jgi:hypothetical protein
VAARSMGATGIFYREVPAAFQGSDCGGMNNFTRISRLGTDGNVEG